MRFTEEPLAQPHHCCVIPGRDATKEPRGFIDTGNSLPGIDPHIYISWAGAELIAEKIGCVSGEQFGETLQEIAALRARVEELEAELKEAEQFSDAVAGMTKRGYAVRKATGRKPKQKVEA
jgi:hypothetical protein